MIAWFRKPLFNLGSVVVTPAALEAIEDSGETVSKFLDLHVHGDWGCVFVEDRRQNKESITSGGRIASAYRTGNGVKIWIVTDSVDDSGQRRFTTILLPSEI